MLNILSWNIAGLVYGIDPLKDRIRLFKSLIPTDVSIICFQEVLKTDVEIVAKTFTEYKMVCKPDKVYGQVIMVKNEIKVQSLETIKLYSQMNRVANKISIRAGHGLGTFEFDLFSFHLESMPYNVMTRIQQMIAISSKIETNKPTVLCGDTNMIDNEIAFFKNSKDVGSLDEEPTYFGNRFGKRNSKKRYDRFYTAWWPEGTEFEMKYVKAVMNGKYLSDHDGIVLSIKL